MHCGIEAYGDKGFQDYSADLCRKVGLEAGLTILSNFEGNHNTKGCYAYDDLSSGNFGNVYYGTGGTVEQMSASSSISGTYRPAGYDKYQKCGSRDTDTFVSTDACCSCKG
jgi:hypothetical protein